MSDEKIQQLSMIENSLTQIISQKQQYQKQALEIDTALEELKGQKEAYQIVGTLMLKKESKEIIKSLEERKNLYNTRLESITKQEAQLKKQAESLREELVNKDVERK